MAECPHLVIGMGGRCEWCFEYVEEQTGPLASVLPWSPTRSPARPEVLSARWASRFGEPEDYRKAMEELRSKENP